MKGDFHIHTTYSDGSLTVDEILKEAESKLDYFAITDHDSVEGAKEAYLKVKEYNVKLILGVEISTYLNNESIHILGYFKNIEDLKGIEDFLKEQRALRSERCVKIKGLLKEHFDIDLDITRLLRRSCITRKSIANEMIRQGMPYKSEEIFARFLGDNCKAYIPSTKIDTLYAVNLLKKCNAITVLAHPVRMKKNKIEDIINMGIDGIEAVYSINTLEDTIKYKKIARDNNLFITAGSDFHHFLDSQHGDVGSVFIEKEDLEIFINKLRG